MSYFYDLIKTLFSQAKKFYEEVIKSSRYHPPALQNDIVAMNQDQGMVQEIHRCVQELHNMMQNMNKDDEIKRV